MTQNVATSLGITSRKGVPQFIQMGALKRRRSAFQPSAGLFLAPLPSDAIGSTNVVFVGVNATSEIRIYDASGSELAGIESCAANQAFTWPVYAPGSPNNNVRVVIVHFDYKIKEFAYTSTLGNQSIPIQQEADPWAVNP